MGIIYLIFVVGLASCGFASVDIEWEQLKGIDKGSYYTTTEDDPWMLSAPFSARPPEEDHYLLVEMSVSKPVNVELRWFDENNLFADECTLSFRVDQVNETVRKVVDLNKFGTFQSLDILRLDPGNGAGVKFRIHSLEVALRPFADLPAERGQQRAAGGQDRRGTLEDPNQDHPENDQVAGEPSSGIATVTAQPTSRTERMDCLPGYRR
jgi:hypothetical protein